MKNTQIIDYFVSQGFEPHQAAGIYGNIAQESGFNNRAVNPKSGAFGLAQWLGPRKKELKNFANSRGEDISDEKTQLAFINHELNTTEKKAKNKLLNAKTAGEAATVFSDHYERAGAHEKNNEKRASIAEKVLNFFIPTAGAEEMTDGDYTYFNDENKDSKTVGDYTYFNDAKPDTNAPDYLETAKHKAGVSGRGVIEGVAGLPGDIYNLSQKIPGMVTDALKDRGYTQALPQPPREINTEQFGTKIADSFGLPQATDDDSIIYPASKTIGGFVVPATLAAKAGTGPVKAIGAAMGGNSPITSTVGILAGQTASDTAKKAGRSENEQLAANIIGNMAAGIGMGTVRAVANVASKTGKAAVGAGLEGVAGRTLNRAAGDESAIVQQMLESGKVPTIKRPIKGYKPMTSEVAGNAGVSTILRQSGLDADAATAIQSRTFDNVKTISDYAAKAAGTPERKLLMQTKGWKAVDDIANPMRARNLPVDLTPVIATLDDAIARHSGNKAITKALEKVKKDLPVGNTASFNEIYNFKQGLDEALRANAMTDPKVASLQRAKTALTDTKKAITETMTATEPEFKTYLERQAKNIQKLSQRTAADEAIGKTRLATPMVSNQSGSQEEIYALSNAKLTALVRNKKEMAKLSPAQRRVIETAQKHAALASRKQAGSMVGSQTAQNLSVRDAVANDLQAAGFGEKPTLISKMASPALGVLGKVSSPFLNKFGMDNYKALSQIFARAELEPAYAAELMKKYGLGHMNFNDKPGRAALRGLMTQGENK